MTSLSCPAGSLSACVDLCPLTPKLDFEQCARDCSFNCDETDPKLTNMGWWTPYPFGEDKSSPLPEGCDVVHIELLARHGSRHPDGELRDYQQFEDRVLKSAAFQDEANNVPDWMKNWSNEQFDESMRGELLPRGEDEHFLLAKRLRERYPDLLEGEYRSRAFPIESTSNRRNPQSANAFGRGFMEDRASAYKGFSSRTDTLSPSCAALNAARNVAQNGYTGSIDGCINRPRPGSDLFEEWLEYPGKWLDREAQPIADRLTAELAVNYNFTVDDAFLMREICIHETAVLYEQQQFCTIFDDEDFEVFEYTRDLCHFWYYGAVDEVATYGGGYLLGSMLTRMRNAVNGNEASKLYMAAISAGTMLPLYASLGLFADSPFLTPDTPQDQRDARLWRDSAIVTQGSNLQMQLVQCPSDQFYVRLLHNEGDIAYPGCDGNLLCPWEEVMGLHGQWLDRSYFEGVCATDQEYGSFRTPESPMESE